MSERGTTPLEMLHQRHWTPDEANQLRPLVGATVRRIRAARHQLADQGFDPDFATHADATGGGWAGRERAEAAIAMALGFEQLERLDIVVRDLERGLVDFPAVIDGHEVYLCWLLDEPQITHFHGVESGFAGRRPLPG
jgi:hypothetical protein